MVVIGESMVIGFTYDYQWFIGESRVEPPSGGYQWL